MGKIKGCGNESCEANKKKITYKDSEEFCSKCGKPLFYICKDCYTQLPNDSKKFCVRCLAKHEDRKDKTKKAVVRVGGGALVVGSVILTLGIKVVNVTKKFKG